MRWLKVSYMLSRTGAPILLSATLASGCGETSKVRDAAQDSGRDSTVSVLPPRFDSGAVIPPPIDLCTCEGGPYEFTIPFPAEGAAATPESLCADVNGGYDAGLAVASGRAARITMVWASDADATRTTGSIFIAPELAGKVVGVPTVFFVPTGTSGDMQVAISNVRAKYQGFVFDAAWSKAPGLQCSPSDSWTFKTTLQIQCDGDRVRAVESSTNLRLCNQFGMPGPGYWISSGYTCLACATICEMAPSPIVPVQANDNLPLGGALTVSIRSLAKVGNALVLLAVHEGGANAFSYTWSVSTGEVETLERDVALWRLPEVELDRVHMAQVAVVGAHAAAVASLRRGPCLG